MNHYTKDTLVAFEDLRSLIREEITKVIAEVKNQKQNDKPKPLSIAEVANRYDKSKATVHNWMKMGIIKGFKMGKGRFFHLEELEESLQHYRYLDILEDKGLKPKRPQI